jgi:hypothetical protein
MQGYEMLTRHKPRNQSRSHIVVVNWEEPISSGSHLQGNGSLVMYKYTTRPNKRTSPSTTSHDSLTADELGVGRPDRSIRARWTISSERTASILDGPKDRVHPCLPNLQIEATARIEQQARHGTWAAPEAWEREAIPKDCQPLSFFQPKFLD